MTVYMELKDGQSQRVAINAKMRVASRRGDGMDWKEHEAPSRVTSLSRVITMFHLLTWVGATRIIHL